MASPGADTIQCGKPRATRWWRGGLAGAGLVIGGCSALVHLDDLVGKTSGLATEAGPDAQVLDALVDASAGADGGGGAASFTCAGADASFCDDFDDDNRTDPKGARWDTLVTAPGAGAVLETSSPASAPRAVKLTFAANVAPPPGDCNYEELARKQPVPSGSTATHARYAFDMWLGDSAGAFEPREYVAHVAWTATGHRCSLIFQTGRPRVSLLEQFPVGGVTKDVDHELSRPAPPPGEWHRYAIDFDVQSGALRLEVDGVNALGPGEMLTCATFVPTSFDMSVGYYCGGNRPSASELRFDNVTFDTR